MKRRREFMSLLGGAAAWPLAASAQQSDPMRHVGVLMSQPQTDAGWQRAIATFLEALEQLGWVRERNLRIEFRWGEVNPERIQRYATELVGLKPDLILCQATPSVAALQRTTRTIPIVFVNVSDPLGSGFIESLARPGGNITGFTNFEPAMGGKWVELIKEIAPPVTRIALMSNPNTSPQARFYLPSSKPLLCRMDCKRSSPRFMTMLKLITPSLPSGGTRAAVSFCRQTFSLSPIVS